MPSETVHAVFDDLAGCYDRLVEWSKRLAREGPFFRDLFEAHGVRRVADVGCGTGHHAAMFHSWGLDVEGTDISPAMLERCRQLHGEDEHLRWVQRSFTLPPSRGEPFDAVVCLGNSLALADDLQTMRDAVRAQIKSVRPSGIGVIQVLNLGSVQEGPTHWQKVRRFNEGGHTTVLLKGLHRSQHRGFVDVIELKLPYLGVEWRSHSASFLGVGRDELTAMIRECGGQVLNVYGSYERENFAECESTDLIVVWWRVCRD